MAETLEPTEDLEAKKSVEFTENELNFLKSVLHDHKLGWDNLKRTDQSDERWSQIEEEKRKLEALIEKLN